MNYGKAELKKEATETVRAGIDDFRRKYDLGWNELVAVTCGDIVESLAAQKVLYSDFKADYAVFEPASAAEADRIAAELQAKGVELRSDRRFGDKVFLYVFSPEVPIPGGAYPEIPPPSDWVPPFTDRRVINNSDEWGEMTPFYFGGELYLLMNFHRPDAAGKLELGCSIYRESDWKKICEPWTGVYFTSAFVHDGKCRCFARNEKNTSLLCMTESEDLVNWSTPEVVLDMSEKGIMAFNSYAAFDGERFVLAYECNDPAYPIFTLKFLESPDMRHWQEIPGAIYGDDKYIGGPSLYYMADGYYYLTYVDQFVHPAVRRLSYRTLIARSKDLKNWEDAPDGRAVVMPEFASRPQPEKHPEVFEINTSDAEYIEIGNKVRAYFNGGNQQGVGNGMYAECEGTLLELFQSFFR